MSIEKEDYISIELEGFEAPRNRRQTPVKRLKGLIWITYALQQSGLKPGEFSKEFIGKESNLIYKWTGGKVCPGQHWVDKIANRLDNDEIRDIYDLPLFPLLELRPLNLHAVEQLLSVYCDFDSRWYPWRFKKEGPPCELVPYRAARRNLFELNNLHGFIALLGLFREAIATRVIRDQVYSCAFLYRALPAAARLPWVKPHRHLFFECLENLRMSCFATAHSFEIDWDIINKQIEVDVFNGRSFFCAYDFETKTYEGLDDPILYKVHDIHRWIY